MLCFCFLITTHLTPDCFRPAIVPLILCHVSVLSSDHHTPNPWLFQTSHSPTHLRTHLVLCFCFLITTHLTPDCFRPAIVPLIFPLILCYVSVFWSPHTWPLTFRPAIVPLIFLLILCYVSVIFSDLTHDCFRPAIVPLILCFSLTTGIGSLLVFASGGIYGIMALGKKWVTERRQHWGLGPTSYQGFPTSMVYLHYISL